MRTKREVQKVQKASSQILQNWWFYFNKTILFHIRGLKNEPKNPHKITTESCFHWFSSFCKFLAAYHAKHACIKNHQKNRIYCFTTVKHHFFRDSYVKKEHILNVFWESLCVKMLLFYALFHDFAAAPRTRFRVPPDLQKYGFTTIKL